MESLNSEFTGTAQIAKELKLSRNPFQNDIEDYVSIYICTVYTCLHSNTLHSSDCTQTEVPKHTKHPTATIRMTSQQTRRKTAANSEVQHGSPICNLTLQMQIEARLTKYYKRL